MKGTVNVTKIPVSIRREALMDDKWIAVPVLLTYLQAMELKNNMPAKSLRTKFCDSLAKHSYETTKVCGLTCINIEKPMRKVCPLEITFEVIE